MVIAKIKWVFMLLFFIIFVTIPQAAASTEWQIIWNDNNNLVETVLLNNDSAKIQSEGWQCFSTSQGTIYKRNVKDWAGYDKLADRLPVTVTVKDYLIFKSIAFKAQHFEAPAGAVAELAGNQPVDLSISVPGLIRAGSADEVKTVTAVWHLKNLNELNSRGRMLIVNTFDGFMLGLLIIVLGVFIIGLVFMSRIRKTHKLIEREYSLENLTLPIEQSEETNKIT